MITMKEPMTEAEEARYDFQTIVTVREHCKKNVANLLTNVPVRE